MNNKIKILLENVFRETLQEKMLVGPKGHPKRLHWTKGNHEVIEKPQALIDKCIKHGCKDKLDGVSLVRIKTKKTESGYAYAVQTHRATCPWYDSPESISIKHIKFIESTG